MNKRWQDRFPATFEVIINYPALGLLRGQVQNLSNGGMYITTSAISIDDNTELDLIICHPEIPVTPLHISAIVIHSNEQGIGVRFRNNQPITKNFLPQLNAEIPLQQLRSVY